MSGKNKRAFIKLLFFINLSLLMWLIISTIPNFKSGSLSRFSAGTSNNIAWVEEILATDGPIKAYQSYQETLGLSKFDPAAHQLGHRIGQKIYELVGAEGIAICDQSQKGGCFHGWLEVALTYEDKNIFLSKVKDICERGEDAARCLSNLGTGFLYVHRYLDLNSALNDCDLLSDYRESCYQGVFKEYNDHSLPLGVPSEEVTRDFPADNFEPCSNLAQTYLEACYYEEPLWWKSELKEDYRKIGQLCQSILDDKNRLACFRGAGRAILTSTRYNEDLRTGELCKLMPSPEGLRECIFEAVRFLANRAGEKKYQGDDPIYLVPLPDKNLCSLLLKNEEKECLRIARIS